MRFSLTNFPENYMVSGIIIFLLLSLIFITCSNMLYKGLAPLEGSSQLEGSTVTGDLNLLSIFLFSFQRPICFNAKNLLYWTCESTGTRESRKGNRDKKKVSLT